jgi:hypothetical protein
MKKAHGVRAVGFDLSIDKIFTGTAPMRRSP